jgi:hypothetical protein
VDEKIKPDQTGTFLKHYRSHEEMETTVRWLETIHKVALVALWPTAVILLARWYGKKDR